MPKGKTRLHPKTPEFVSTDEMSDDDRPANMEDPEKLTEAHDKSKNKDTTIILDHDTNTVSYSL